MDNSDFLKFGSGVRLINEDDKLMWARGFMDSYLYLSEEVAQQCQFHFEQKRRLSKDADPNAANSTRVIFGTEILIRNSFSGFYLCSVNVENNDMVQLKEQEDESCYFELLPLRSFEHEGDYIHRDSTFVIRNSLCKSYLTGEYSFLGEKPSLNFKLRDKERESEGAFDRDVDSYNHPDYANKSFCLEKDKDSVDCVFGIAEKTMARLQMKSRISQSLFSPKKEQRCHEKQHPPQLSLAGLVNDRLSQLMSDDCLPLFQPKSKMAKCALEKHEHSSWRLQLMLKIVAGYLEANDYIFFVSSNKMKGLLSVSIEKGNREVHYVRSRHEEEDIYSAIFIVEIEPDSQKVYLRHLLTGEYFPHNEANKRSQLTLKALTVSNKNQLPPFHLYFDGEFFPRSEKPHARNLNGFWLNKVDRKAINEILSIQNVPVSTWIPYLTCYLTNSDRKRQDMLQQFQFVKHIICRVIPMLKNSSLEEQKDMAQSSRELLSMSVSSSQVPEQLKQHTEELVRGSYQLLFRIIRQNDKVKRECIEYIPWLLRQENKQYINDVLSQLLDNDTNFTEKYVPPPIIKYLLAEFVREDVYSVTYMRIFRLFCGHDSQPCTRNQDMIGSVFFGSRRNLLSSSANEIQSIQFPDKYRFVIEQHGSEIMFSHGSWLKYEQMAEEVRLFMRQYWYLQSDTMKMNERAIQQFCEQYPLQLLLNMLQQKCLLELHGPIINLIVTAYMQPHYKHKLYIFYPDYEKMCYKGQLLMLSRDPCARRIVEFVQQEVEHNKDYSSTKFRHLLRMIAISIQSGYWHSMEDLLGLVDKLRLLHQCKEESRTSEHRNYGDFNADRNLMKCKIMSVNIMLLLLDLQINLWISELIDSNPCEVNSRIQQFASKSLKWKITQNNFKLCSTEDSELMRKSLLLFEKLYNISSNIHQSYHDGIRETHSSIVLKDSISLLEEKAVRLDSHCHEVCFSHISLCVRGIKEEEICSEDDLRLSYSRMLALHSVFKYHDSHEEYQNLSLKLGLFDTLCQDVRRYTLLRRKDKEHEKQHIYWKLLLLLAISRRNNKLVSEVSKMRDVFVKLLEEDDLLYYVSVDILTIIYRDNRNLIVSDQENLERTCLELAHAVRRETKQKDCGRSLLKICKLLCFLRVFLIARSKKIKTHHQLILRELFNKDMTVELLARISNELALLKTRKDQTRKELLNLVNLFKTLLFSLLDSLEQKPKTYGFELPELRAVCDLVLRIGHDNWQLKAILFSMFSWYNDPLPQQEYANLLILFKSNLNYICEQILKQQQRADVSPEMEDIQSSIPQIFIAAARILNRVKSQTPRLQLEKMKILQRLHLIRPLCSPQLRRIAENLRDKLKEQFPCDNFQSLQMMAVLDFATEDLRDQRPLVQILQTRPKKTNQQFLEPRVLSIQAKRQSLQVHRLPHSQGFRFEQNWIEEIKEFILSLVSINKSDSTVLSDELKSFFVAFLIDCFLAEKDQERFVHVQDMLVSYQIPSVIASILEESFRQRYSLFDRVFMLGIQLLEGGNKTCQLSFMHTFRSDSKNCIFQNILQIIQSTMATIRFHYHYTEPAVVEQEAQLSSQRKSASELLKNIFRFLQLLCQNDNHDMKRYVFSQTTRDDAVKYLSVNFVEVANKVLDQLMEIIIYNVELFLKNAEQPVASRWDAENEDDRLFQRCEEIRNNLLELPGYILDFLIEVCQLPAVSNQLYLCKTDFFDIIDNLKKLKQLGARVVDRCRVRIFQCNRKYPPKESGGWQTGYNERGYNESGYNEGGYSEHETVCAAEMSIVFMLQRKVVILFRSLLQEQNEEIIQIMKKKVRVQHLHYFVEESFEQGGVTDSEKLQLLLRNQRLNPYLENIVDVLIIRKVLRSEERLHLGHEREDIAAQLVSRIRSIDINYKDELITVYFSSHPLFSLLSQNTKEFFIDKSVALSSRNDKLRDFLAFRKVIYQDIENEKNASRRFLSEAAMNYLFASSLGLAYVVLLLLVVFYSVTVAGTILDHFEKQIIRGLSLVQLLLVSLYTIIWGVNIAPLTREKIKTKELLKAGGTQGAPIGRQRFLLEIYFQESSSFHVLLLFVVSACAVLIEVRLYCLTVLYVFVRIQLLNSILKAIRLTWKQLAVVCVLAVIFSFIFGFLTINNYIHELYDNEEIDIGIDSKQYHCSSMLACIDSLYTQNIIGETVGRDSGNYGRFLSDLIHWSFFEILFSNIIAAIIIDKFAEQRHTKEKVEEQKRNKCFVCWSDRAQLQRKGVSFTRHVEQVHNIWNYFFYMYYLEVLKDITEFTGIEYWIKEQIKAGLTDWIPVDESLRDDTADDKINLLYDKLAKRGLHIDKTLLQ